ncbi:GNAT family N-acetyltransferase [Dyella flagellata]|uniref:N-acetyltransferase n=1 Tax=Dyella flagellata TaxID=1867833 RepID=A0ABQ5XAW9_9GAMM|nr:GNAT family N-acetyltransferase [Dyella flagellata]GLQ88321.1 N-acetyltransferase [Dyella flagellata]
MFEPVTIDTKRLRLRPLRKEDASAFFEMWSDPETVRYFSFPPMQDIEQAHARITDKLQSSSNGHSVTCVIESRDTGEVIGDCGLFNGVSLSRRAEIGYCLGRKYWGKGYMAEAADALIEHGFKQAGLHRIEADIDPRNLPSIQLIERLGFRREGYLRERWLIGGEVADTVLYGLIQSDRY